VSRVLDLYICASTSRWSQGQRHASLHSRNTFHHKPNTTAQYGTLHLFRRNCCLEVSLFQPGSSHQRFCCCSTRFRKVFWMDLSYHLLHYSYSGLGCSTRLDLGSDIRWRTNHGSDMLDSGSFPFTAVLFGTACTVVCTLSYAQMVSS